MTPGVQSSLGFPRGIPREEGARLNLSTFFRKKFLPDFLSPLLVRTPRWRIYRLMAVTTAALREGDSEVRPPVTGTQEHAVSPETKDTVPHNPSATSCGYRKGVARKARDKGAAPGAICLSFPQLSTAITSFLHL